VGCRRHRWEETDRVDLSQADALTGVYIAPSKLATRASDWQTEAAAVAAALFGSRRDRQPSAGRWVEGGIQAGPSPTP